MKIWTEEKLPEQIDPEEVSASFWDSEYGRVAGEKCYPLDTMLERFLANAYDAVVWNTREFELLRVTVMHNWPEE